MEVVREDGETETVVNTTVTAGLSPQHKAAVVLFLERVYGVQDQITFYRLLENGFLPDLRAATTLEEVSDLWTIKIKVLEWTVSRVLISLCS